MKIMNQISINKMNSKLPVWDLSEIYIDIKDPNIKKDISKIRTCSNSFLKNWKGFTKVVFSNIFVEAIYLAPYLS